MGWEVYPRELGSIVQRLSRDHCVPRLLVTENGLAFLDAADAGGTGHDEQRISCLPERLRQWRHAPAAAVPLRGHHAWSLPGLEGLPADV